MLPNGMPCKSQYPTALPFICTQGACDARQALAYEMAVLRSLSHPNIMRLHWGAVSQRAHTLPHLVLELLGNSLSTVLPGGRDPAPLRHLLKVDGIRDQRGSQECHWLRGLLSASPGACLDMSNAWGVGTKLAPLTCAPAAGRGYCGWRGLPACAGLGAPRCAWPFPCSLRGFFGMAPCTLPHALHIDSVAQELPCLAANPCLHFT